MGNICTYMTLLLLCLLNAGGGKLYLGTCHPLLPTLSLLHSPLPSPPSLSLSLCFHVSLPKHLTPLDTIYSNVLLVSIGD